LPQKGKNNYFLVRNFTSYADAIAYITRRLLFMYAYSEKCHSNTKKILNLNLLLFKENILCNVNHYLEKKDKLNNRFFE